MSGQLASWVSKHYQAGPVEKAVAIQYALVADPHGRPTYILTVDDLVARTGHKERAVYKGRRKAKDDKVLRELEHGGGKGIASRFRVMFKLCPAEEDCPECRELRLAQAPKDGQVRPDDSLHHVQGSRRGQRPKDAPRAANPAPGAAKGAPGANQTEYGGRHPSLGGAVPPGESSDRAGVGSTADAADAQRSEGLPDSIRQLIATAKDDIKRARTGNGSPGGEDFKVEDQPRARARPPPGVDHDIAMVLVKLQEAGMLETAQVLKVDRRTG